ncbi:5'-methylthioadenosine/S-adenosylhomocysteine nucleosidase [Streptomyces sp. NPDC088354]|uniref:5'-methylthioadenosine/S-adenosylhomocysteine nucleosidase n=1 Tax=Streptomyces sp. NPDC088354 TaxID=3365856 RepID=UPI00382B3001
MIHPSHRLVVLTALPLEYQAVLAHLTNLETHVHETGTRVDEGSLPGTPWRVALAELGEGNTGAGVLTERISSWLKPAALLFIGVAGSLKDDINIGDVVAATKIYAYQGGKVDTSGFYARPSVWESSHWLEQAARQALRSDDWIVHIRGRRPQPTPRVHFKPVAAGDVVLNARDSPLSLQLRQNYNDAVAIEMESAGFARAAHLAGQLPVLTIRGISDKADGNKHAADANGSQPAAAAHAAAAAIAVITALTPPTTVSSSGRLPVGATADIPWTNREHTDTQERDLKWKPLAEAVEVNWRRQAGSSFRGGPSALELHLVPVPSTNRIEVRKLAQLHEQLIRIGRENKFFSLAEHITSTADGQHAMAIASGTHQSSSGLTVWRTGQRSAWQPLPHDSMGGVLDPDELPRQISGMLTLLAQFPVPDPGDIALGIGIDPATMVSEDKVSRMPRNSVQPWMKGDHLRVHPDETVTMTDLAANRDDIAEELAARLLTNFRAPRRGY